MSELAPLPVQTFAACRECGQPLEVAEDAIEAEEHDGYHDECRPCGCCGVAGCSSRYCSQMLEAERRADDERDEA